ncbi:hypothetical protein SLEP1_g6777 [Rubroshorea leprosula]|uniref:Phytocyanin domain-containing protein n=1 Tax=Rubroshorea leprosula TaxID=152421 RepID=A0AAV5HWL5_9ROSI|nr:hypothetical protein SLEP1_g6777 [Rubroshorea leprosula]
MGSQIFHGCFMVLIITASAWFITSSEGYKFYVGGRDGWVVNPKENFNHWAERNRFSVNDTLFFKYKKGSDSVLVVKKEDYFSCNATNPTQSMMDGDSEFKFDRSGPFFFITGNAYNCNKGQKLIVVVLAVRHKHYYPPKPTYPSPSAPLSSPVPVIDSPLPPSVSSPPSESPEAGGIDVPSGMRSPRPAPTSHKNFGSLRSELPTLLVVGLSVGIIVVLAPFSVV